MNVVIIGTGYVGLTTGVILAYLGNTVTCIDIDKYKIEKLRNGIPPIYEKGLEQVLQLTKDRLYFATSYKKAIPQADLIFFCVGTPPNDDGSPNLEYLKNAFEETLKLLEKKETPTILVNKSTVPVGTADRLYERVRELGLESRVIVASNPEFLRQGQALQDTLYPDRIVVGGDDVAVDYLRKLYDPIIKQSFTAPEDVPRPHKVNNVLFISVDRRSAELAKYAANAFLAMKISFINEIANVCDRVGADVTKVAEIIGADPRIGPHFLRAGIGYGGSCFPKDTRALRYIAQTNGYTFKLLSAVIEVNNEQKFRVIEKLKNALGSLKGKKIAVLGLTFKPDTDDMREAPSIPIIRALVNEGAEVWAHDPVAVEKARGHLPIEVKVSEALEMVVARADAVTILTEWEVYRDADWNYLGNFMNNKVLIDGRNALNDEVLSCVGFNYYGVGRSL